jgi:carbonic anhydrase
MSVLSEVRAANEAYAASFREGDRPTPPARQLAVLVCMDSRIDLFRALGLQVGDAHIIRNAGGRASQDAVRSLIISSRVLGTREFMVIHHTECGLMAFDADAFRARMAEDTNADASGIDFLEFDDLDQSVRDDVATIKGSPFLSNDIPVSGFVYDVKSGKLLPVS